MPTQPAFIPSDAAAYLEELATRLQQSVPNARETLAPDELQADLVNACRNVHAWAERNGIPEACVPAGPTGSVALETAVEFLRQLAAALRWLDAQVAPIQSMPEIVARLRTEDAGARHDLEELELALREMCHSLWKTQRVVAGVCRDLDRLTDSSDIRDRADGARMALEQLVIGLGAMHQAVRDWGVPGRDPSQEDEES